MNPQSRDGGPSPSHGKSGAVSGVAPLLPLIAETTKDGTPAETVVHIAGAGEGLASLVVELDKRGAAMRVHPTPVGVMLRIQGASPVAVQATSELVVKGFGNYGRLQMVQVQRLAANTLDRGDVELPAGTALRMNLTKRLLMILPTGGYIVSNCFNGFAEVLGPRDTREGTWSRILKHRANGRLFMLFASPSEGLSWGADADGDTPF